MEVFNESKVQNLNITPTLSVILSFYNEAEVLQELIIKLRNVLDKECELGHIRNYELIFVDDASTDCSEQILKRLADAREDIKIITMSRNFGVSECVLAGMAYASGDLIVYMDTDLQDPPEVIPELLHVWRTSAEPVDVVHTVRRSRAGESRLKLWVTRIGYLILQRAADINLQLEAGDFKLLSRRVVDRLVQLKEKKPFFRGLVCWVGFNQKTIYYDREPRFAGKTKFFVFGWKVIRNFLGSALISFSDVPLRFSLFAGFIVSLSAFFFIVYVIIVKILGYPTQGWSVMMASILFLGGMQLLTIGVLGLYINSIYLETKGRPNYIVKSTFGFKSQL